MDRKVNIVEDLDGKSESKYDAGTSADYRGGI